jgi:3-isopropylmalate/(R)-2-methylmalate dehydratase small subunit
MTPFPRIESRAIVIAVDNIDTDQIIPARFLTTVSRAGLGANLFHDWRYDASGRPRPDFILNQPGARGAVILVAGHNFGCGSSREHAPWALAEFGFRAIVSTAFADIFRQNALKNGIVPVLIPAEAHAALLARLAADPAAVIAVDVEAETVTLPGSDPFAFPIDRFARECLLHGVDEIGFVLRHAGDIDRYEKRRQAESSPML